MLRTTTVIITLGGLFAVTAMLPADGITYPPTKKLPLVEDYHGAKVADPYRWLEDDVRKSDDVKAWVERENSVTFAYLHAIPQRTQLQKKLTTLWNYERYSVPTKVGGHYFYSKNDGLQNQAVLYMMDSLGGEPRVVLDPNKWSKDGTVALSGMALSDAGRHLAYGIAEAGSDWVTWHILDLGTLKPLADEIRWVKFNSPSWTPDGKGLFYGRYDEPKPGEDVFLKTNLNQKLYYHRVGSPQSDDVLVYKRPDHPDWGFQPQVTEDGRYLVFSTWKGTDHSSRITYRDLSEPFAMPIDLIDHFDNEYALIDNDGPIFYFKTDLKAPKGRVIAIDIRKPDPANYKEIIPEAKENLSSVGMVGNLFVASYLKDAKTEVKLYSPEGKFIRDVAFPGFGTAAGFAGRRADTKTFYTFSSYATPPSIYSYDLITGESKLFRQSNVKFKGDDFVVKQVFYPSKDGTKVPMFITHKKGVKLDGTNPTMLYGYGGFNISLTPEFSIPNALWLEMGGVYAVANLRGGGEYGQDWHKAGTKLKKQNVFDDFIGAAEYLIQEKYTSPAKLAIKGRSNGGLLVGAAMTQRPDLFGVCLPGVGVMDMLRFQKFTAGRFWVDDYGSSDNAEEFKALYAYSPYHNLKKGIKYPATLITTADTDDRVVPGHSFKFAARLQEYQTGQSPVLIRIETRAGHGAGKPIAKLIEEVADELAFVVKNLNMNVTVD